MEASLKTGDLVRYKPHPTYKNDKVYLVRWVDPVSQWIILYPGSGSPTDRDLLEVVCSAPEQYRDW